MHSNRSIHARAYLACVFSLCLLSAGCQFFPKGQVGTLETQNRILTEQNKAQLSELENLKVHSRDVETRLLRSEEELAVLEERGHIDRQRLANFQNERERLDQLDRVQSPSSVPPESGGGLPADPAYRQ